MADSDFALIEIFDAEGVAEGAGEFLELKDLANIGFFVDAIEGFHAAGDEVVGDGAIGGEHEFFDDAVSDIAFAAADVGHALLFVEFDDGFRKVEVDRTVVFAAGVEEKSESAHGAEVVVEVGVALGHFSVAGEDLVDIGVSHPLGGTDNAGNHDGGEHVASGVEVHDGAHDQAFFAGVERAHAVGERFGEHRNGAVDEVDGIAAQASFAVERRLGANVVGHVGDVNLEEPAAVFTALDVHGVVEVAGGFAVDRDDGKLAKILATGTVGFGDGMSDLIGVVDDFGSKGVRQVMLTDDDFGVHAEVARAAENFGDPSGRSGTTAAVADEFGVDDGSIELRDVR